MDESLGNPMDSIMQTWYKVTFSDPQMGAIVQHWVPPLVGVADLNFDSSVVGNLGLGGVRDFSRYSGQLSLHIQVL